jgi:VanZ family protein
MNAIPDAHPAAGFLAHRYVELLTVLIVLFILATGLAPFEYAGSGADGGSTVLFGTTANRPILPDIVSNIFLYFPLGVMLHWTLRRTTRGGALVWPVTVILAAGLSAAIEWAQAFSPVRVSSLIDLVGNVVGASLGASVSFVGRRFVRQMVGAALVECHWRPRATLARAYVLVLFVFAAIPFSFSFDAVRLKQAVRSANFIPFRTSAISEVRSDGVLTEGEAIAQAHMKWRLMKRWSRFAAESASFVLLAWLVLPVLIGDYGFGRGSGVLLCLWLGGALAVALGGVQLVVITRGFDITDVLSRIIGLVIGVITCLPVRPGERPLPALRAPSGRNLARFGLAATVAYIVYTGVIPLTFDAARGGPSVALASKGFLPFWGYFIARFDVMMADAMEKLASYAVFAGFWAACQRGWFGGPDGYSRVFRPVMAGVLLSALVEIPQMYIPVRVTSLTDPILAAAGCLAGALLYRQAIAFYDLAAAQDAEAGAGVDGLSPADRMLATLYDPDAAAPTEPSHRPRRTFAR